MSRAPYRAATALFEESLAEGDRTACWVWPYSKTSHNIFGTVNLDGKACCVRRAAWSRVHRPLAKSETLRHSAGPQEVGCWNPWHQEVGPKRHRAALSEETRAEVRRAINAGERQADIARRLDISEAAVSLIKNGKPKARRSAA